MDNQGRTHLVGSLHTPEWQDYYDQRFASGYADAWPLGRYTRIRYLLRLLSLPRTGTALDFGCGNGSFSQMLFDALPDWTIVGADVSAVALENAARNSHGPTFIPVQDLAQSGRRFDLIFSHHVLEHVPDVPRTWRLFESIAAPTATLLHVLPCGNPGSLEHRLCMLRVDGIDSTREGRFFCDDEPHLRRLTTTELASVAAAAGFQLKRQFYSQHFWSQLWPYAQKGSPELRALTDVDKAVSRDAAVQLAMYRILFLLVSTACLPTLYRWRLKPRADRRPSDHIRHAVALLLSPVSAPLSRFLRYMDEREWERRREDDRGAEMYLAFQRSQTPTV